MSSITAAAFETVTQLESVFANDIGNTKLGCGTGFWIRANNTHFFVTNRHNVDPTIRYGDETAYKLYEVKIRLRRVATGVIEPETRRVIDQVFEQETRFFEVAEFQSSLILHPSADVAVLREPVLEYLVDEFGARPYFDVEDVADANFFQQSLNPMDSAAFIGFPGYKGQPWWDQKWGFPIARPIHLSSLPAFPFSNDSIPTTDVMLVSGLSFSGSSGSPVISYPKGIRTDSVFFNGGYVPPKVIGIMSGHWNEEAISPESMFFHSGLSYCTRSTAILELLNAATAF